jgi:magnesium-transporting ATPase (P-type)
MSVIVKCPDGVIRLFIKGADSVIKDRVSQNTDTIIVTDNFLSDFAGKGLRTLMVAYKEISELDYDSWSLEYKVTRLLNPFRKLKQTKMKKTISFKSSLIKLKQIYIC